MNHVRSTYLGTKADLSHGKEATGKPPHVRRLALIAWLATAGSVATQEVTSLLRNDDLAQIRARIGSEQVSVQRLALPAPDGAPGFEAALTVDGLPLRIRFEQRSIRAPGFTVLVKTGPDAMSVLPAPPVTTYVAAAATLPAGDPIAVEGTASLAGGQLQASLRLRAQGGEARGLHINPVDRILSHSLGTGIHVVTPSVACDGLAGRRCGNDEPVAVPRTGGPVVSAIGVDRVGELGVYADYCYYASWGTTPAARISGTITNIEAAIMEVNARYFPLGIRQDLAAIVVITTPEACTGATDNSDQRLGWLRTEWNQNYAGVFPNVWAAHLFTAKNWTDYQTYIGKAFLPGWCRTNDRFGVNLVSAVGPFCAANLVAHELGHNWNAGHCDGLPGCGIMTSTLNCSPTVAFGPAETTAIQGYALGASCLHSGTPARVVPFFDSFEFPTGKLDPLRWESSHNAIVTVNPARPSSLAVRLKNTDGSRFPLSAYVRTPPLDFEPATVALATDIQLRIRFEAVATATSSPNNPSQVLVEYTDAQSAWRTAGTLPLASLVQNTATSPFEVIIPRTELHYANMRVRITGDLEPNEEVYIDDLFIERVPFQTAAFSGGHELSVAGDIRRNGQQDLLVSETRANGYVGEVRVHFTASPTPRVVIPGPGVLSGFGTGMAVIGDLDLDGFNEVAVGAPGFFDFSAPANGQVFVFKGRDLDLGTATPFFPPITGANLEEFGFAIAAISDIDADGKRDFVVGAPNALNGGMVRTGAVYAHSGATGARIPHLTVFGAAAGDRFGRSLDNVGRVDADTLDDFVVGMQISNAQSLAPLYVRVFSGSNGGSAPFTLLKQVNSAGIGIPGSFGNSHFGYVVRGIGDFNGDGLRDIAIGIPGPRYHTCYGCQLASGGSVYVTSASPASTTGFLITEANRASYFGLAVARVGDFNRDGRDDLAIGAPFDDRYASAGGRVVVHAGVTAGTPPVLFDSYGFTADLVLGDSMAGGDFDGNGFADVAAGGRGPACGSVPCSSFVRLYSAYPVQPLTERWTGTGRGVPVSGATLPPVLLGMGNAVGDPSFGITIDARQLPSGAVHALFVGTSVTNAFEPTLGLPAVVVPGLNPNIVAFPGGRFTWSTPTLVGGGATLHFQVLSIVGSQLTATNVISRFFP